MLVFALNPPVQPTSGGGLLNPDWDLDVLKRLHVPGLA